MGRVTGYVRAVDAVSFDLYQGECLGLVGESGSGKTTVARSILRAVRPTSGELLFHINGQTVDVAQASSSELKRLRRHMQMIFQDPFGSLNPRMTVFEIIGEPLLVNGLRDRRQRKARVRELLRQVGLNEEYLYRYPHAFSGGQRQRIGIARALALHPKLIVADEPVSALDVSVQAQVLNLLLHLQRQFGLTYLLIAHDLGVIRHVSDRVAVMYAGKLVELATVDEIFTRPAHPYTEALLSAIPKPDPERRTKRIVLKGEAADPSHLPTGCAFHPRCPYAQPLCAEREPLWEEVRPDHFARCHFALNNPAGPPPPRAAETSTDHTKNEHAE
ncbi:MAG: ATP-binding cassette domain-containing protein [Candidatus Hydrogenedentes bacterium]|nr:ATP-binding cassette domain-containing protein [Candidatus Hydrogenedentota bacterium]